jgi:hypothetical protein
MAPLDINGGGQNRSQLLKLTISGPEGSFERELGPGTYVIGGSLTADVIVVGMSSSEVLQLTARGAQVFDLKALTDGLVLNDAPLPKGKQIAGLKRAAIQSNGYALHIEFTEPLSIPGGFAGAAAAVRARITSASPFDVSAKGYGIRKSVSAKAPWNRNPLAFAALGFAGLLAFAALSVPRSWLNLMPVSASSIPVANSLTSASSLVAELKDRLRAADLLHLISISESGQSIRLTGTVSRAENLRLRDLLSGFQGRLHAPLTIANTVAFDRPDSETLIGGIVLRPIRAVVAESGELVPENEMLPSGWRVSRISETAVELTRDGLTQSVAIPAADARDRR